ncbi:hypothetical protein Ae406Ps2_1432 [Pseudonocardia sp. Ae406_Ps2]|nr:hypothetical protein Ae406Ps2_1432 [Pseudonocardia sp. Ae406_Ps2]OLM06768.1 hypothetical protein Ae331Ps2_4478c [Pseudonocardia sp. Ae331_Ps2]OLM14939.1 hypothetical protein Ae505Ps2_5071 [Pseudonocardia sp. Ae505_Ps2]OLM23004.1 hypothetical protein Ae706Ps2_1437 [Pseudonocardia sp. Ae706_Ps2]
MRQATAASRIRARLSSDRCARLLTAGGCSEFMMCS